MRRAKIREFGPTDALEDVGAQKKPQGQINPSFQVPVATSPGAVVGSSAGDEEPGRAFECGVEMPARLLHFLHR
jgi:hypothetical protein